MTKKSFNEKRYEKELWGDQSPFREDEPNHENNVIPIRRFGGPSAVAA